MSRSNSPRPVPIIRFPNAGYVRVECSVDCASCGVHVIVEAIGPQGAEKAARALGWRCIRMRWFCPKCLA